MFRALFHVGFSLQLLNQLSFYMGYLVFPAFPVEHTIASSLNGVGIFSKVNWPHMLEIFI